MGYRKIDSRDDKNLHELMPVAPASDDKVEVWRAGRNHVTTAGELMAGAGGVTTARQVNTTAPLTGGGDLTADRTLGISAATAAAAGSMSAADKAKLDGVAAGATANSTDAQLRDRATHTGTQGAGTITGLAAVATSGAKADVGLGNVDNTSDADKPVSTAQQAALDGKAPVATRRTLAADHANSTTTLATITDGTTPWSFAVTAGRTYLVRAVGSHWPDTSTTGIRISVVGSGGAAGTINGAIYASIAQSSVATEQKATINNLTGAGGSQVLTTSGTTSALQRNPNGLEFVFVCTTSGTISIQFASQVDTSTVTFAAGSTLFVQDVT